MTNIWTLHTINDGKWQVVLHIRESKDFAYQYEPRPDIRALVDANYHESPETMAKLLLDNVLHCDAVQINMLAGPSIRVERTNENT